MDVRHPTDTAATEPVRLRRGEHKGWDAWWIERGPLALALVPQVGGRVMSMQWRGNDIAFTMTGLEGQIADPGLQGRIAEIRETEEDGDDRAEESRLITPARVRAYVRKRGGSVR